MELDVLFSGFQEITDVFTITDVLSAILLSFALSLGIAWVYKVTYKGMSYHQSYVQTLILMSMLVAVIMLIIGSNIARAFSLVGALSIIRFRNAMKDTRDVGFIFFAMSIGMACGTGFYTLAVLSTVIIGGILLTMNGLNMFDGNSREQLLKIRVPEEMVYEELFERIFDRYLAHYKLLSIKTGKPGELSKVVYLIEFRQNTSRGAFMNELRRLNEFNTISLDTLEPEPAF
jgi:hypothetical protein